ncbi:MAG: hypothetical protein IT382_14950 [Deltaproteobacteria bacterium]|nr:hypothetical protein [Deltaproteobacteria bacterium]
MNLTHVEGIDHPDDPTFEHRIYGPMAIVPVSMNGRPVILERANAHVPVLESELTRAKAWAAMSYGKMTKGPDGCEYTEGVTCFWGVADYAQEFTAALGPPQPTEEDYGVSSEG